MRKIAIIAIGAVMLFAASCNKSKTTPDSNSADLKATEALLNKDYSQAQQYESLLVEHHKTPGMTMMDPTCKMYDSLYHMPDTSFTMHFREYCLDMMKMNGMGSNGMMNGSGGMMGGSGGMMCNMDSMFVVMGNMMNMNTFKMDSMMLIHEKNCPSMGTMTDKMKNIVNNMQVMRKEHMSLHK
jgi:hypothetical protein